jgi:hypothetical protein
MVWLEHVLKLWAKTLTVSNSYTYKRFLYFKYDSYVASVISAVGMHSKRDFDLVYDIFALTITNANQVAVSYAVAAVAVVLELH